MSLKAQSNSASIGIFFLLALIWGSSFILIKKAIVYFDPYQMAALRIGISAICFFPFLIKFWGTIDWSKWKAFLLVGLTGSGIPAFMYPIGQSEISSSVAGILNSTTPIFTFIIGILLFRSKFVWLKFIGIILGLLGTCILIFYHPPEEQSSNYWYAAFILVGTLCYGININVVKSIFQNTNPLKLSAVSFTLIGPPALAYLAILGNIIPEVYNSDFQISLASVLLLAIFGTVISTVLFFRLVQKSSAVFASSVAYVIPIVAILWGFLDGEQIGIIHFAGMALILIGVYAIRKS